MPESLSPLREFDKLKLDGGQAPEKLLTFPERWLTESEDGDAHAAAAATPCPGFPCRIGLEGELEHAPEHYLLADELCELVMECRWLDVVGVLDRAFGRENSEPPPASSTTSPLEVRHAPPEATKGTGARRGARMAGFLLRRLLRVTTAFTTGFTTEFVVFEQKGARLARTLLRRPTGRRRR